jgi:hypothetical protein
VSPLDRELAFWIQFAEIWKDLAHFCDDPLRRSECLDRAQMCLRRAQIVRQKLDSAASRMKAGDER